MMRAARGGVIPPHPKKFCILHTFLKEIKLVEKVDFPQYLNIWYIFLDLKKINYQISNMVLLS
jgi:predicted phosphatase